MSFSAAAYQKNKSPPASRRFLERGPGDPLGGFGSSMPITQENLYSSMAQKVNSSKKGRKGKKGVRNGGGTGSVTTKRELGLIVTDFFDYSTDDPNSSGVPQFVNNYYWDVGQNLLMNSEAPGGQEYTFCRVRKVEVWVLPTCRSFVGSENINNAQSAFTVNCQVPGMGQQFNAVNPAVDIAYATNTQVTNVLPRIDTRWKKVLTCDLQKTFQSGNVRPVFVPAYPTNQCIFQMSIVDQTSGRPYLGGAQDNPPIRVKVKLTIDQPIATTQNASLTVWRNEEFALPYTEQNGTAYSGASEQYVQMDLASVRDNFR